MNKNLLHKVGFWLVATILLIFDVGLLTDISMYFGYYVEISFKRITQDIYFHKGIFDKGFIVLYTVLWDIIVSLIFLLLCLYPIFYSFTVVRILTEKLLGRIK